jgi:hypothetical protein
LRAPRCVFNFSFGFEAFLGIAGNPLLTKCDRRVQASRSLNFSPNRAQHAASLQR